MDAHTGEHPRIGAVDVIPFVPLGDTTMDEASSWRGHSAPRIADRFDLPVYLYAQAATRSDRVKLADVRRGQYEGLKAEIGQHGREPDFGPGPDAPAAGAVAVGARPFLIAYNINLDSRRRGAGQADRPARSASPVAGCRRSRRTGSASRSRARHSVAGPGLDEPARLRG